MTRIVLLVLAIVAFVWLLRRALGSRQKNSRPPPEAAVPELVACAYCGVHLPKNEALEQPGASAPGTGKFFCCEEHRRKGPGPDGA